MVFAARFSTRLSSLSPFVPQIQTAGVLRNRLPTFLRPTSLSIHLASTKPRQISNFTPKNIKGNSTKKGNWAALSIISGAGAVTGMGFFLESKTKAKAEASDNICDLSRIYSEKFNYSLPRTVLEGFISGNAIDNKKTYTPKEAAKLAKNINAFWQKIMASNPVKEKIAVICVGSPGIAKTTLMEADLETEALKGRTFAYISPDDNCLKELELYQNDLSTETTVLPHEEISTNDYSPTMPPSDVMMKFLRQQANKKWLPASNAMAHVILGNLTKEGYGLYTTSSESATEESFNFLKKQGYIIRLLHTSAPDNTPQHLNTYLKYVDTIEFYFRDQVHGNAVLAATWKRENNPLDEKIGAIMIHNLSLYSKIIANHNAICAQLKKPDLNWQNTVEAHSVEICFGVNCKKAN